MLTSKVPRKKWNIEINIANINEIFIFEHRLDDEQEATTLEMPTSSSSIPTVASLLETNQSDVDELKKNPKKANQSYFYFFINLITIDNRHYNL